MMRGGGWLSMLPHCFHVLSSSLKSSISKVSNWNWRAPRQSPLWRGGCGCWKLTHLFGFLEPFAERLGVTLIRESSIRKATLLKKFCRAG